VFVLLVEDSTGRLIDSDDDELLLDEEQATKLGHYIGKKSRNIAGLQESNWAQYLGRFVGKTSGWETR